MVGSLSDHSWRSLTRAVCVLALLGLVWPVLASEKKDGGNGPKGARAGAEGTTVLGTAWQADNTAIPHARLRLRDTHSGRVVASTVADENGQFSFTGVEPGSYLIELVSEAGKVLALGHAFTIAPGETVATFVRLGTRAPWFTGFFSNAAAAVASTAAAAGVTALAPGAMRAASAVQ